MMIIIHVQCNCSIVNENITIGDIKDLVIHSFKNAFQSLNYKFIICYKLVFHINVVTKNIGSLICLALFLLYLIFLIMYIIKGITSLKKSVNHFVKKKNKSMNRKVSFNLTTDNNPDDSNRSLQFKSNKKKLNKSITEVVNKNSPLESLIKVNKKENNKNSDTKIKGILKKKKKRKKSKSIIDLDKKSESISKKSKNKKYEESTKNYDTKSEGIIKKSKNKKYKESSQNFDTKSEGIIKKRKNKLNNDVLYNNSRKRIKYTEFELNNLDYDEAIINDRRSFNKMYLSKLKKGHLFIFTFFATNDFNLIYVKIARFALEITTNIAMNALFFSDQSMHKIYLNYGKYDLVQQIPQIIYSSLISLIFDFLISFLITTEKQVFQIISLKQKDEEEEEKNNSEVDKIFKMIKIKFIIFFVLAFLLFAFFWYFISAFCAVYENTQITFIKDFVTSFSTGLLYPFVIYYFLTLLRKLALKDKNKKRFKCLYIIGNS